MATYRGAKYVREQIQSILDQLAPHDEIVVVDDASLDDTADVIAAFNDPRVKLHRAPVNRGYVRTFEHALILAKGEFLLLSDQDDVWPPGRLQTMLDALSASQFVTANYAVLGGAAQPPATRPMSPRFDTTTKRNLFGIFIGYRPYFGCAMGFRRSVLAQILPIPDFVFESHDLWIALNANAAHTMRHLDSVVVLRRLHDNNVTPLGWRPLGSILRARVMLVRGYLVARRRVRILASRG